MPQVSVILNSFNAKERLFYTLLCYENQNYPKEDFEVIIVDDCSTDGTEDIFTHAFQFNYKYIRNDKNSGRAVSRNIGLKEAAGEIIIFSDGDMLVPPDFISQHASYHLDQDVVVCGAFWNRIYTYFYKTEDQHFNRECKKAIQEFNLTKNNIKKDQYVVPLISEEEVRKGCFIKYTSKQPWAHQLYEKVLNKYGKNLNTFQFPWIFFIVMNCSVKSQHLEKVGFFDENFWGWGGEDEELGYRLWKAGLKFIVDPAIENFHQEHPRRLKTLHQHATNNINYTINKHSSFDIFLYYNFSSLSLATKNQILLELKNVQQNQIVNEGFSHKLYKLNQEPISEDSFIKEIEVIKKTKYKTLSSFISFVLDKKFKA